MSRLHLVTATLLVTTACLPGTPVPENEPPVAEAGADLTVALGDEATFDGSGSHDPDDSVVGYSWNFGDGNSAEGQVVTHTFAQARRFVVSLTVTDEHGDTGRDELIVTVEGGGPVAAFSWQPTEVHLRSTVTFDASASAGPAELVAFDWSFGDGDSATGATVTHAFDNTGTFRVSLTVTDADGAQGEAEELIEVIGFDVDGTWDLLAQSSTFSCTAYDVAFNENELTITGDGQGGLSATSAAGHDYSGSLEGVDFTLSTSYSAATGGGCATAPVTATLSGSFAAADQLSGTWLAYYDLSVPCQCSAAFPVTGQRR